MEKNGPSLMLNAIARCCKKFGAGWLGRLVPVPAPQLGGRFVYVRGASNVFGWSPCLSFEVLRDVRVVELSLPEVSILGFSGKGLSLGWM